MLNLLLALLSAGLLILAFPNFNFVWLAPVALAPLLVGLAREPRLIRRFLWGWAAGIVYWFGVCYWIQYDLAVHGGTGEPLGWALFLLFCLAKGLHLAVFSLLAGILMRRWWATPTVAALWVAIEVTHGSLGFAWLALGNAGIDMGIPMRLAPVTGVYGLSFLFAMFATALARAIVGRSHREMAWLAAIAVLFVLPAMPAAERGRQTAVMLQPNIAEDEEFTEASLDQLERELMTTTLGAATSHPEQPPSLLIWPEVPAPFYFEEDPRFRGYAEALARTAHASFLAGVVAHTAGGSPLNSAVLLSPSGGFVSRYDKVNLVPFGEFVPWPFTYLVNKISTEAGDFAAGKQVVVSPLGSHRLGVFICYESAFPNFVRKFADRGAELLVNISNDGWFGRSAARRQHLNVVRMRAAENRRWVLRSTNDGITAVIDSAGRIRGTLPPYEQATSYTGYSYIGERTPYTRFGDWFALVCATIAIAGLLADRVAA